MIAFWDSSAVLPLCVFQPGASQAKRVHAQYDLAVWWLTPTEVWNAIARVTHDQLLSPRDRQVAELRLSQLRRKWREIEPNAHIRDLAAAQMDLYRLRTLDALQIAAALAWCQENPRHRPFVCRDRLLLDVASRAGFDVVEY